MTHAAVPVFSPRLPVVLPPAAPKMVDNGRLDYTKKEDYGKVPAYLGEVKAQIDEERTMIQEMLMQQDVEGDYDTVTELSDSERKELIAALPTASSVTFHAYYGHHLAQLAFDYAVVAATRDGLAVGEEQLARQARQLGLRTPPQAPANLIATGRTVNASAELLRGNLSAATCDVRLQQRWWLVSVARECAASQNCARHRQVKTLLRMTP